MAMEEDGSQIDLESLMSSYSGHGRINRLIFIAEKKHGHPIELEALRMAHDEVKQTENLVAYTTIVERIAGRLGSAYQLDRQWYASVERATVAQQERLESELASHKANLIKESIRMGYTDLGDHYYRRGDLTGAMKNYVRSRDYCTSGRHIVQMCMNAIRVALEQGNYVHVSNYVAKAENTPLAADGQVDAAMSARLAAALGLSLLATRRYKLAARKLLEVTADIGPAYNDVLAMQDVATYGSLCALASFDRDELQRRLIKNVGFKELLDTVPEIRELVHDFHSCKYGRALPALNALSASLNLDIHLESHVSTLIAQIRQRALIQYASPFTSLYLASMAKSFNTTAQELAKELSSLIMEGQIKARIDAHAGVLYARQTDERVTTFEKALGLSEAFVRNTKAQLLRVELLKHDFIQKPRVTDKRAGGAGTFERLGSGFDFPEPRAGGPSRAAMMRQQRGGDDEDEDVMSLGLMSGSYMSMAP